MAEDTSNNDEENAADSADDHDGDHDGGHDDGHADHGHADHGNDKVPGALRGMLADNHEFHYFKIWGVLTVLFLISYFGPFVGEATGIFWITFVTAFGIAFVKAGLVIREFMHLFHEPKFLWQICATALVFMLLFFFWVAPDVLNHEGANWVNVAAQRATGELGGTASAQDAWEAQSAYETTCGVCHGNQGGGDGVAGGALDPRPANFTDPEFWETRDRDQIRTAIAEGGPAVGKSPLMAAFGPAFTDDQLEQIVDLVMGFGPETAEPVPVAPDPMPIPDDGMDGELVEVVPADGEAVEAVDGEAADGEAVDGEAAPEVEALPTGPSQAEIDHNADFIRNRVY